METKYALSAANEDYLEAIYELQDEQGLTRSVDLAEHLQVSKASVNKAVGILREAGLVEQERYDKSRTGTGC